MNRSAACGRFWRRSPLERKKTAEALRQEVAREGEHLLQVIFQGQRKSGRLDLEAIETAVRSAMHRAGAAALSALNFPAPANPPHTVACPCGQQAAYRDILNRPGQLWRVCRANECG